MNFLIDVHLPISLSKFLSNQAGCKSIHVNQILQKWHTTDAEIGKYADEHALVVVTKDNDFKNSYFINRTPKKVIRIGLGNVSNKDLISLFEQHLSSLLSLNDKPHFYAEISEQRILVID